MEAFKKLGLSEQLLKALHEEGFTEPREIQEKTIPLAMAGKDVLGGSATGSGKTLAFGASIIEHSEKGKGIQAIILTPTRELAEQVSQSMRRFSRYKPLRIISVYGGVSIEPQIRELRDADVVVGTPGRILDHLERRTINLRNIKTLVLDEADRMLDMGFIDDVKDIIENCPENRQTLLFSATLSADIKQISHKYMKEPVDISIESYVDPTKLKQIYYDVPRDMKFSLLVHLLKHEKSGLVMVFCNTRRNTDFVARHLEENHIESMAIHGGLSQAKRNKVLEKFNRSKVYVLVCTDVAARGLDIQGVSHVYNYDIPPTEKEYIHRIGRTARAGKEGIAVNIVADRDYDNFRIILRNRDIKIEEIKLPEMERVMIKMSNTFRRPFGDRRPSHGGYGNRHEGRGGERHRGRGERSSGGSYQDRRSPRGSSSSRYGNRGRTQNRSRPRRY